MKRVELFEFEDFSWFPNWLRTCITNLIVILQRMMGIPDVLARLLKKIIIEQEVSQIVDLGSGSGGVMPSVLEILHSKYGLKDVTLLMTDLYPNKKLVQRFNSSVSDKIKYHGTSVDATNIALAPKGLKTMINSFHHMSPGNARNILKSAQENRQPIVIYEMGENNIPLLVWILFLPLGLTILMIMVLFMTPFVRPLTWQQIIFTYLIPIIPICYAWDGQASLPRMYTFADMDKLLNGLEREDYSWEKGYATNKKGNKKGTYLRGTPLVKHKI